MNKSKKFNSGFTLIELLVVIAIIGILAGVVLAALGSARSKGKDAAVQSEIANMRSQADIYYSANGNTYGTATVLCSEGMFADAAGLGSLLAGITAVEPAGSAPVCASSGTAWAVSAPLPSGGDNACADSTGFSGKGRTANTTTTVCS